MATGGDIQTRARLSRRIMLGLVALTGLTIVPYLVTGPGLFLDDWELADFVQTRGILGIGARRFTSRPGSGVVYTVLFGALRAHPWAWVIVLNVLFAACAVMLFVVLARFVPQAWAGVVAAAWILLPDHMSLRVWPCISNVDVALIVLFAMVLLLDDGHLLAAGFAGLVATSMYELVAPLALLSMVVLGLRRGKSRDVAIGAVLIVGMTGVMALTPTYPGSLFSYGGTPYQALHGLFGRGLTTFGVPSWLLAGVAVAGTAFAALCAARGERSPGSGPWLVGVGWVVVIAGLTSLVFHMPSLPYGTSDRLFSVSTIGAAMVWVGIGRLVLDRSRPLAIGALVAWAALLAVGNVSHARDWSSTHDESRALVIAVDRRFNGSPPPGLTVGPQAPGHGGVLSLDSHWAPSASHLITGRRIVFNLAEGPADWATTPGPKLTVDDLLDDKGRPR